MASTESGQPADMDDVWGDRYADAIDAVIDRTAQVAEDLGTLMHDHPNVARILTAVVVGTLVGVVLSRVVPRRRQTPVERARETMRKARPDRVAGQVFGFWRRAPEPAETADLMRSAAALVPVALRLLGNPLVRQFVLRTAMRNLRRPSRR